MSRFRSASVAAAVLVVGVVAVAASGVLSDRTSSAVNDLGQLLGGAAATVACAVTGLRTTGAERRWRLLMAAGFAGWTGGQALWTWSQVVSLDPIPSPSLADVGYLTLPVFALPSLLVIAAAGRRRGGNSWETSGRSRSVLVLDALVIVGSMSVLTWSTVLSAVVMAGAPTRLALAVAVAYPISDLVLVAIALLALTLRRVERRPQLLLLVLGLVAISVSDSVFAYLVSSGAADLPPIGDVGFVAGPFLVALAALAPIAAAPPGAGPSRRSGARWHLLVPYVPLTAVGILLVVQTSMGRMFDRLEVYLGLLVLTLVVTRQFLTLRENTILLERVQRGREELSYQAFHDPLTGLPNRALFGDRLAHAADLQRDDRHPIGLLFVDLDDFKIVNDTLGHAAGDALLRQVGQRLRGCVPLADTVARLGGDEFAVLVESDLAPTAVADRVVEALARPFPLETQARYVRASIGLVVPDGRDPAISAESLLRRADAAMYAAKRRGGGAVVLLRARPDLAGGRPRPAHPAGRGAAPRRRRGGLPADRPAQRPQHGRGRGAGPVDRPGARAGAAGGVRGGGRAHRADRRPRRPRARPRLPGHGRAAGAQRHPARGAREHLGDPARRPGAGHRGRVRAAAGTTCPRRRSSWRSPRPAWCRTWTRPCRSCRTCAAAGSGWRSTTSAPATERSPACTCCRSTWSSWTGPSRCRPATRTVAPRCAGRWSRSPARSACSWWGRASRPPTRRPT